MVDLLELAARVEGASGADRELDLAIWAAIDPRAPEVIAAGRKPLEWLHCYTSSLDAAMTLVPEGMQWSFDSHYKMAGVSRYWDDPQHGPTCEEYAGEAATPALALTAAALRARAATPTPALTSRGEK